MEDKELVNQFIPNVTFDTNPGLNALLLSKTLALEPKFGADFRQILINTHPEVANFVDLPDNKRLDEVKKYLFAYYKEHAEKIDKSVGDTKKVWDEFAPTFFREVEKIFPNTNWPNGQYVGHVVVSPPCPRFLDMKTFCTAGGAENSIKTTAHEMLHFIFYEYIRNRYLPDMENTIENEMNERLAGKFKLPLLNLSEIFNLMILSKDEWGIAKIDITSSAYKDLIKQVPEFQKVWDKVNHNIYAFFTELEV